MDEGIKEEKIFEDGEKKFAAKCVLLGRLPREDGYEFKTAGLKLFDTNNAHLKGEFPQTELIYPNIEKIRIRRMNVSYYLEGNDMIVNNLEELRIIRKGTMLVLRGYQGGNEDLDCR